MAGVGQDEHAHVGERLGVRVDRVDELVAAAVDEQRRAGDLCPQAHCGARVETAVMHYKPSASLFPNHKPTYYAAVTESYIVYPWEVDRRPRPSRVMMSIN